MSQSQPTEVEIRIASDGGITPLRFTWQSAWLQVMQIGRAWADDEGDHWLVMPTSPNQVFELLRTPEGRWRVIGAASRRSVV